MKYCILSVGSLFHFGETMRNGCSLCNGRLYINNLSWNGHSMSVTLVCGKCSSADSWTSSSKLPDGSFEINRDVTIAWLLSGGERIKYEQFTETLRCGTYSRASWDNTIDLITPIILEAEDDMYKNNIQLVNQMKDGCIVGFDCQHSRSQRKAGSAPFATTSFMCHNQGQLYGKLLYQSSICTQQMKESGKKGTESKDKITTETGLIKLAQLLINISKGICDGSSSGNKSWSTILQSTIHKKAELFNCMWHKLKNLPKDFKKKLFEKKVKLAQKQGNKQYELLYSDLQQVECTPNKVKNHLYHSVKMYKGDAETIFEEFKGLANHYEEYGLSNETKSALESWLENQKDVINKIREGLLTDLEESFHRTCLKYWKKGTNYNFNEYIIRRALAGLDWNENFGKKKETKTTFFKKKIQDSFLTFLKKRKKGPGGTNAVYQPKSFVVVDYVF